MIRFLRWLDTRTTGRPRPRLAELTESDLIDYSRHVRAGWNVTGLSGRDPRIKLTQLGAPERVRVVGRVLGAHSDRSSKIPRFAILGQERPLLLARRHTGITHLVEGTRSTPGLAVRWHLREELSVRSI
jgi:hypothetical protein